MRLLPPSSGPTALPGEPARPRLARKPGICGGSLSRFSRRRLPQRSRTAPDPARRCQGYKCVFTVLLLLPSLGPMHV